MATYPIDQPVRLTFNTYSDATRSTLADATAVTLWVKDPTGTETSFTLAASQVVKDSTGTYHYDYTPSVAGHYQFHWSATGTATSAADGDFDVRARYGSGFVTVDDVRAQINETSHADDDEIQQFIDAATEVVEDIVGAVVVRSVTDTFVTDTTTQWPYHYGTWPRYTYGIRSVDLRTTPVVSVSSVSVSSMDGSNAVTLATSSYRVDTVYGTITVIDASAFGPLVTVTYTAGRSIIPANIRQATLILIQHMWNSSQTGPAPQFGVPGVEMTATAPMSGYAVPNAVIELLQPNSKPPVVA